MKPSKSEVLICYNCPNCGSEWWYNFGELKFTTGIQCGCGQILRFDPISNIKVTPIYGTSVPTIVEPLIVKSQGRSEPINEQVNDVIKVLRGMGYGASEAKQIVQRVLASHSPTSEAEFLSLCFKRSS